MKKWNMSRGIDFFNKMTIEKNFFSMHHIIFPSFLKNIFCGRIRKYFQNYFILVIFLKKSVLLETFHFLSIFKYKNWFKKVAQAKTKIKKDKHLRILWKTRKKKVSTSQYFFHPERESKTPSTILIIK